MKRKHYYFAIFFTSFVLIQIARRWAFGDAFTLVFLAVSVLIAVPLSWFGVWLMVKYVPNEGKELE